MKIAVAQINPVIADIEGNRIKILSFLSSAREKGADLVVFPEMATLGYPPMDLLENRKLIEDNLASLETIARAGVGMGVICGYVDYNYQNPPMLFNAAAFLSGGRIQSKHFKTLLPTYDVFDETRYFTPAENQFPATFGDKKIGITICEDIWNDLDYEGKFPVDYRRYETDPVRNLVAKGIDLLVAVNASPYVRGKNTVKWDMLSGVARKNAVPLLYVNQVGGNDSLIFDGNSFLAGPDGAFRARASGFKEDLLIIDMETPGEPAVLREDETADIHSALVLGLHDYVRKCGFTKVVVGLSGGIDSALTAALATEALGPENVMGITMPSPYSSKGSVGDSVKLAKNLGIRLETIPIAELFAEYKKMLETVFRGMPEDVTEENIQARIRGNILMAVSNKYGCLLLTTGNKSELAMGYCTLYGDMAGGLAVISDLPKTLVYRVAEQINRLREIIPVESIRKPPSAELRPGQKDEDSLPPYEILDRILEKYIEKKMSAEEIIRDGFPGETVRDVLAKVNRNEYKRIQAAPGLKVTSKAFGIGRRIPIAHQFRP